MRQEQQLPSKTTESTQSLPCEAILQLLKLVLGRRADELLWRRQKLPQPKKFLLLMKRRLTLNKAGHARAKVNL